MTSLPGVPITVQKRGLSGATALTATTSGRFRIEKEGKLLWQKTVPGKMSRRYSACGFGYADQGTTDISPRQQVFQVETAISLEAGNEFDVPAGSHYVSTAYDPETGDRLTVRVSEYQAGQRPKQLPENTTPRRATRFAKFVRRSRKAAGWQLERSPMRGFEGSIVDLTPRARSSARRSSDTTKVSPSHKRWVKIK